jgi:putative transposase
MVKGDHMPRKPRIYYEGALYHVMVRGNNGEKVFEKEEEKEAYINIIKKYKKRYKFNIYAYCLMDNHAHLLIEVKEVPLSKIMQGIQQVFTQRYNKKYNRTGHIFQQRYKSILCQKEAYLFSLIKYIHYNPVKAKKTENLEYKWSSHNEYTKYQNDFIDIEYILSMLGTSKNKAIKEYKKQMQIEDKIKEEDYKIRDEEIEEIIEGTGKIKIKRITLEEVIKNAIEYYEIERKELESGKRVKRINNARKAIVILAKELTEESNKEMSKALGISESGISKIISRENVNDEIDEIRKRISLSICQA